MYDKTTIGTCSRCGGRVQVHTVWGSVIPDTPTCADCGAVKRQSSGPVIDMEPADAQSERERLKREYFKNCVHGIRYSTHTKINYGDSGALAETGSKIETRVEPTNDIDPLGPWLSKRFANN